MKLSNRKVAKRVLGVALAGATVLWAGSAVAATSTSFTVQMQVLAGCDFGTADDISFTSDQSYNYGSWTEQKTGNITLTCTNGSSFNIALTPGNSDTTGTGEMSDGTDTIPYQLAQDAGGTAWGNVSGTNTKSYTGTGSAGTLAVYANLGNPATSPEAGTYTDTVTVTVAP